MTQFDQGRYRVRITDQCFTESTQKGTLGLVLAFRVLSNLSQPDAPVKQFQRDTTLWITDKTAKRVLDDLHGLGYLGTTLSGVHPATEGFHDFRDLEIEMTCKHEPNERGEVYEQWNLDSSKPKLKDRGKLQYFDDLLRANGGHGAAGVAGIADNDVPF
jgi:hypothetical protein